MNELAKYQAARRALAEAKTADEVMQIHDVARAMRAAAQIAKDRGMEIDAWEMRQRAERRLGELIAAQKATEGLNEGALRRGREQRPRDDKPTLKEAGISKDLSSRAQKLAAIEDEEFDDIIAAKRDDYAGGIERIKINLLKDEPKPEGAAPKTSAPRKKVDAATAQISPITRCAAAFRRIALEHAYELSPNEWPDLVAELQDELDDIKRTLAKESTNASRHHAEAASA